MSETITIRTSSERDIIKIVERGPQGASSGGGSGSVTSVALASSDLTITGSPITASGTITADLANSGATAGTYTKVTVDAKGRVTSGASATSADISDLQTNGNAAGLWDSVNGEQLVSTGDGELQIRKTGTSLSGALNASILSADRGYNLPDASGTLALTTTVIDNAAGLWDSANSVRGAYVNDYELSVTNGTNTSSLAFPVGASRSYLFPNAAGTLALTSDITKTAVGLGNVTNAAQVTSVTGTAPIVSSGGTTPAISISAATTSAAGSMSAADKTKLDGIASGATANSSDATLLARANHTGTQAASTITGLASIATSGSASDLGSGTVPTARLGSGTASASTFLAGDQTYKTITSGATGAAASASDVVGVSGSNITGTSSAQIDSADPFVKYDTANNKLTYANPLTKPTGKFAVGVQPTTTALGTNAINIQSTRAAATDVASGNYSINIGVGKASGSSSICIDSTYAPYQGYVSGNSAVSVGPAQYATATGALALGNQNNASGTGSIAMGAYNANATADNAYAIGRDTNSSAIYAVSIGYQVASPLRSQFNTRTFSSVYWGGQTTDATANVVLNLDATATNRFTISASTMVVAQVLIAANSTASGKSSFWHYHVAIRRDGSNNTVLVGAAEQIGTTQTYGSPSGWAVALTADDTNEALQLAVTGEASTTITWRATAFYRVV